MTTTTKPHETDETDAREQARLCPVWDCGAPLPCSRHDTRPRLERALDPEPEPLPTYTRGGEWCARILAELDQANDARREAARLYRQTAMGAAGARPAVGYDADSEPGMRHRARELGLRWPEHERPRPYTGAMLDGERWVEVAQRALVVLRVEAGYDERGCKR